MYPKDLTFSPRCKTGCTFDNILMMSLASMPSKQTKALHGSEARRSVMVPTNNLETVHLRIDSAGAASWFPEVGGTVSILTPRVSGQPILGHILQSRTELLIILVLSGRVSNVPLRRGNANCKPPSMQHELPFHRTH